MSGSDRALRSPRLVVVLGCVLAAWGACSWVSMPRREDPELPRRWAMLALPYPGASAADVERMVVDPLERELWRVRQIRRVESTARAGAAVLEIEIDEDIDEPEPIWEDLRRALERARRVFPAGVGPAELDTDLVTPDAVVLALHGLRDHELLDAAQALERELLVLPDVARVALLGSSGEQIVIQVDDLANRRLALDANELARQLALRTEGSAAAMLQARDQRLSVRVDSAFRSLAALRQTPISLSGGASVPLSSIARVEWAPAEPPTERARLDGQRAIAVAVGPERDVDTLRFGKRVMEAVARFESRHPGLVAEVALFQPTYVEARLGGLRHSLIGGTVLVVLMLVGSLGLRLGGVVAAIIPVVTLGALAVYAAFGGALHQMSIAALVIALGMIVDNALVVTEAIERRVAAGAGPWPAARDAVRELAVPLAGATATTIAAFVPMLLSSGTVADFVRSIPVLVSLALALSYVAALGFTPVLAATAIRPRRTASPRRPSRRAWKLATLGTQRPRAVLLAALGAASLCAAGVGALRWGFFPDSDRAQVVLSLDFGEGTHLEASDAGTQRLERALLGDADVLSLATFVGRAAPLFYYNLNRHTHSAHLAQLVVTAPDRAALRRVVARVRGLARRELPEATLVVQRLRQGTPIDAPLELRLLGADLLALSSAADALVARLRTLPHTLDARHDLGQGTPVVRLAIDDAAASRHGVTRQDVAQTVHGRVHGLQVGYYRAGREPVPIVLRSREGEDLSLDRLVAAELTPTADDPVPLRLVAHPTLGFEPAVLRRRNGARVVTVLADLEEGTGAQEVLDQLGSGAAALLPPGVELEIGGEVEGARIANRELLRHVPAALVLMLLCLLAEFESLRLVGIVLSTLPLAALGIVPGLLLGGQRLDFMTLLGVVALGGIVVNNGIMLIDAVLERRARGRTLESALRGAVLKRLRPVLLTSGTTVAGLIPLAFSSSALWPSLAWPMISGLVASTGLSLVVIPALCRIALRR